jgi:hypothetical protein
MNGLTILGPVPVLALDLCAERGILDSGYICLPRVVRTCMSVMFSQSWFIVKNQNNNNNVNKNKSEVKHPLKGKDYKQTVQNKRKFKALLTQMLSTTENEGNVHYSDIPFL